MMIIARSAAGIPAYLSGLDFSRPMEEGPSQLSTLIFSVPLISIGPGMKSPCWIAIPGNAFMGLMRYWRYWVKNTSGYKPLVNFHFCTHC